MKPTFNSDVLWKVVFDSRLTLYVTAASSEATSVFARLQIWMLAGEWRPVESVERAKFIE